MIKPSSLGGLRIVVTRPRDQAAKLADALAAHGATPISFPTIKIEAMEDLSDLDRALSRLSSYDWVIFTSVNGVAITWERMQAIGISSRVLARCRIAAIGPATAEALVALDVEPSFVPQDFVAESLAAGLRKIRGKSILLPRALDARKILPSELRRRGADVEEIAIYRAVAEEDDPQVIEQFRSGIDVITFTSPSIVRNLVAILRAAGLDPLKLPGVPLIACIGPITAGAAYEAGYRQSIIASQYTSQGLVDILLDHYASAESVGYSK